MKKRHKDLTRGPITGLLVGLAGPIAFSMLMYTVYILADLFFVGRLGPDAVAAVSISGNAFFIVRGISLILGTGAMALVARACGRNAYGQADNIFQQSIVLSCGAGVVVAAACMYYAPAYIGFFGGTGQAMEWGIAYFRIYALSLALFVLQFVIGNCYRGRGDTRTPMLILVQSTVLNIALDPLLIFGFWKVPALGVSGAAIATLAAQLYSLAVYAYLLLIKRDTFRLRVTLSFSGELMAKSLKIGVPSGLSFFSVAVNLLIAYRVIAVYGTEAVAALGIGYRIIQTCYLPAVALTMAMAAIVGQNYGARLYERITGSLKSGFFITAAIMLLCTVVCLVVPGALIGAFTASEAVVRFGVTYLVIMSLGNLLVGSLMAVSAVFQGIGKTYPVFIGALLDNVLFALLVLTLPHRFGWGFHAVWWLKLATTVVEITFTALWLRYELRRIKRSREGQNS